MKQILVVDDEARIREIHRTIFKILGFKVFTAESASDACVVLAAEEIDREIFENADGYFDKSDSNEVLVKMVCAELDAS